MFVTETPSSNNVSHRPADWDYPSTETEKLRYKVFREFWEQGYYMTSGSKFGGDFLVYPGKVTCRLYNVSRRPAVWDYPSTEIEKLRYKVFREFWEQGYYMTSGSKFGGDFLVYPGKVTCRLYNVSHRPAVWDYPSSDMERLCYKVFREFWEQGYYMTSGSKFGGDFLVYPGKVTCIP